MREAPDVECDLGVFEGAVVTALTGKEMFDNQGAGLGFARGVFIEDESLAVILVHGPPAQRLGVLGAGENFDAEMWVHHPFL